MRISVRLEYYTSKTYSDGSHPIILLYLVNGKKKRKVLDKCMDTEWDTRTNRLKGKVHNATIRNNFISDQIAKAEADVFDLKIGNKRMSDVFTERTKQTTVLDACKAELNRLKKDMKSGTFTRLEVLMNQLVCMDTPIDDVDSKWIELQIEEFKKLGNVGSTIQKKIKTLRGIVTRYSSRGLRDDIKLIKIQTSKPIKTKLTTEELERIAALGLEEDYNMTAARDMFLLQVYLRGARIGDLLQARSEDFKDGRFSYTTDKTSAPINLKLIPKAQEIVNLYKGKHDRLFPFFKWEYDPKKSEFENKKARMKHKEACTVVINRHLKEIAHLCGINKNISTHIARHTFARMAIDKIGNPMITMDLLGHKSLAVHQSYLNDIRKDDMLDAVTDDIFG